MGEKLVVSIIVENYDLCMIVQLFLIKGVFFIEGYVIDIKIIVVYVIGIGSNINIVIMQVQVL